MSKRSAVTFALASLGRRPQWKDCELIARAARCSPQFVSQTARRAIKPGRARCICGYPCGADGLCAEHRRELATMRAAQHGRRESRDWFALEPCLEVQ